MDKKYYVEVASSQRNHVGEYICGDMFLSKRLKGEGRLISVLADGMGHGVKANVLATLTATMSLSFAQEHKDPQTIGDIIIKTLPICSERKMSYATFTIVDVDNGEVVILEYDNPPCLVFRGANILELDWQQLRLENADSLGRSQEINVCKFIPEKEDRIVFISDGVTQSGMGTPNFMLGWGHERYAEFVRETIIHERDISAFKLAQRVVNKAFANDNFKSKD
ncbi:MAG: SpoIIE family protein phosphatase, partial [Bacteroidales bacterium]